ncbi:MAG: transposase [Nitrospira sp.]|nr:transposase [Nitrospira sp.]
MTYRKALLDEEVTGIIQETATELAERFPIEMEAMGTDKNHIHGLCGAHPKMAPGRIVQICKRLTAREICRRKPAVKRVLWGGVGNSGQTGTMWRRWASVGTGRRWNGTSSAKGNPAGISDNFECCSSVIPRSLLRGASLISKSFPCSYMLNKYKIITLIWMSINHKPSLHMYN